MRDAELEAMLATFAADVVLRREYGRILPAACCHRFVGVGPNKGDSLYFLKTWGKRQEVVVVLEEDYTIRCCSAEEGLVFWSVDCDFFPFLPLRVLVFASLVDLSIVSSAQSKRRTL